MLSGMRDRAARVWKISKSIFSSIAFRKHAHAESICGGRLARRYEALEERLQFAVTATLANGVYSVVSDQAADTITLKVERIGNVDTILARDANNAIIPGTQFAAATITAIAVNGNGGNDVIHLGAISPANVPKLNYVEIAGGDGNDTITGSAIGDVIYGGKGNDVINSGNGFVNYNAHDRIYGDDGDDDIFGNDGYYGRYTMHGGLGNDRMWGNYMPDSFYGDEGNDTIYPAGGDDFLEGGIGDDIYYYSSTAMGSDSITDIAGNDTIILTGLSQGMHIDLRSKSLLTVNGVPDMKCLLTQTIMNSIENVIGTDHDDVIYGNDANNQLQGGNGNDTLYGFGGSDILNGEAGNDTYVFTGPGTNSTETDTVYELDGMGTDTLDFSQYGVGVNVDLTGTKITTVGSTHPIVIIKGTAAATFATVENVIGSAFDDLLTGNLADNVIYGGGGNDTLRGGLMGNDTLHGGPGDDRYVFLRSLSSFAVTKVYELANQGTDTLDFSAYDTAIVADLSNNTVYQRSNSRQFVAINASSYYVENVFGTPYNDFLNGNHLNNLLVGAGGTDQLFGGGGLDQLVQDFL
jgi:Ca2+-binding RTX toxin-like protein